MNLSDYISTKEAAVIAGINKSHVCRLCQYGKLKSQKIGNSWLILRESAMEYKPEKPGLKLGQKINRRKK